MNYSYLMGVNDITELKVQGFIIEEIDGDYGIKFPNSKQEFYEDFVSRNLEPGYWNEYIGENITFIFKFNNGITKKYTYDKESERKIFALCCEFAECQFSSFLSMFLENEFYAQNCAHILKTIIEGK